MDNLGEKEQIIVLYDQLKVNFHYTILVSFVPTSHFAQDLYHRKAYLYYNLGTNVLSCIGKRPSVVTFVYYLVIYLYKMHYPTSALICS